MTFFKYVLPIPLALTPALFAADAPTLAVERSAKAIALDGRLDEAAWRNAPAIRLTQQSPHPGELSPYDTEIRVIVTAENVYFGFLCRDPEPGKIAIHTMRRDGVSVDPEAEGEAESGDDTVSIALDPFGDRRTGYFFQINAAGARTDGLISGPRNPSLDWDGIWDARAARTADGWSAEIVIPSRTLSFTPGLGAWGLNLERHVARDRMTLRWASPTRDAFFCDLSRAGSLTGTGGLKQGKGIEISPYMVGRMKNSPPWTNRAWQGAGGVDLTWKITPQMATVFTANTDFAETDVDSRQINLARFPLFFPEKRAFFLEGANQYQFGLGLDNQFIPFFSRRIGLLNGAQVPIDAGVKFNGRAGKWNLALLDVQTRDTTAAAGIVPGTNLLAGRVSYDVTSRLRVGTLFTNGDPEGGRRNSLVGADAVWRTSTFLGNKNLLVGAWTATTRGDRQPGRPTGWGAKVDYPNDLWACSASINDYGAGLNPALGFLPRPGVRQTLAECAFQPRPSREGPFGWVRQEFFEAHYARVTNRQGVVESWDVFTAPVHLELESGDRLEANWCPRYEFLAAPFEIAPGVVIPPGAYRFTRSRVEVLSSQHRRLQARSTTWFGSFYSGNLTQWQESLQWTSGAGRLQAGVSVENNFGRLKQGSFVQRLWQNQWALAWSPKLVLTSFVQYDTESQNLGVSTRLRWTIRPGNDLFIVWNRGWQRLVLDPRELSLIPDNQLLAIKLKWTLRM